MRDGFLMKLSSLRNFNLISPFKKFRSKYQHFNMVAKIRIFGCKAVNDKLVGDIRMRISQMYTGEGFRSKFKAEVNQFIFFKSS